MKTTSHGPILVTGAAGQLGAVGRTVTGSPGMSVREFVSLHADEFGGRAAFASPPSALTAKSHTT